MAMYDDDDDYYVEFLRPDGDIEGKDIPHGAWIMVSFKSVMGYGRGLGTDKTYPEERPMHRRRSYQLA